MGWFLVKEIRDRNDKLHFQRYRLLKTPWFSLFLHHICASDEDKHLHDHPFSFVSFIFFGSYLDTFATSPNWATPTQRLVKAGSVIRHNATDAHKLTLRSKSVWTLVIAYHFQPTWGYQTEQGWVDNWLYRQRKRGGLI